MSERDVRFDSRARRDARAAVEWYERQQSGLGEQFLSELDATVERLAAYPEMHPVFQGEIRRALTNKFPYSVHYQIEGNAVVVLAVLHTRRAPDVLDERQDE